MIESATLECLKTHINGVGHPSDDSFITSIAYYALTGRRGAWICEDQHAKLVLCQHPNLDNHLLIFPEIGVGDGRLIADVLRHIDHRQQTVQLARFTAHGINAVKNHLKDTPAITLHQTVEKNLDWQFPIHVLDTAAVSNLTGPNFRNVRQKLRKIDELNIQMIGLSDPMAMKYLHACTKYWEGNQILYNEDYKPNDIDFYKTLFSFIETHPTLFDGFILKYGNRIGGFSVWDTTTGDTANLIANLVDIHVSGLSEYQLVMTCRILHDKGVAFLNRGGSERKGLHNFKKKFSPVKTIPLFSATVKNTPVTSVSFSPFIQNHATKSPNYFHKMLFF